MGDIIMTAMNIVRCVVKADRVADFLALNEARVAEDKHPGQQSFNIVKTGEREYFWVGQWESMDALVAARPAMIATLDQVRDMLEDLGDGLGVTDPRSGEVVVSG